MQKTHSVCKPELRSRKRSRPKKRGGWRVSSACLVSIRAGKTIRHRSERQEENSIDSCRLEGEVRNFNQRGDRVRGANSQKMFLESRECGIRLGCVGSSAWPTRRIVLVAWGGLQGRQAAETSLVHCPPAYSSAVFDGDRQATHAWLVCGIALHAHSKRRRR